MEFSQFKIKDKGVQVIIPLVKTWGTASGYTET